jgi:hypothetical protein
MLRPRFTTKHDVHTSSDSFAHPISRHLPRKYLKVAQIWDPVMNRQVCPYDRVFFEIGPILTLVYQEERRVHR